VRSRKRGSHGIRIFRRRAAGIRRHAAGHSPALAQLPRPGRVLRAVHQHGRRLQLLEGLAPASPDALPLQQRSLRRRRPLPLRERRRQRLEPRLEAREGQARLLRVPPRPRLLEDHRRQGRPRGRNALLRPARPERGSLEGHRPEQVQASASPPASSPTRSSASTRRSTT
jgi:hypothetical protein